MDREFEELAREIEWDRNRNEAADAEWDAPPELTELRVGGAQLPDIVDLAQGRKTLLENATISQWIEGIGVGLHSPQREGYEIARILLERAGNDQGAKIIDHVDPR